MSNNRRSDENSEVNLSPVGWYATSVLIRAGFGENEKTNLNSRCLAWENYLIIKAKDPDEAYEKAIKLGKAHADKYSNSDGEIVTWVFEGLTMLVPIYEELEDGAEIGWSEHKNTAVKTIKSLVKSKDDLEVFQKG
jgi:hypothetical protein